MNKVNENIEPAIASPGRIESLDVLRGFALLGMLLVNILIFGLNYYDYSNPLAGSIDSRTLNIFSWAVVDIFFEGAMRGIFSMLFGAGIAMMGYHALRHFKRMFWLLMFGIVDAFLLLWVSDILIVYALCGLLLYLGKKCDTFVLFVTAAILIALLTLSDFQAQEYYSELQKAAILEANTENIEDLDEATIQMTFEWEDYLDAYNPENYFYQEHLEQRSQSYFSAFSFTKNELLAYWKSIPYLSIWDALAMMLFGMVIYRLNWFQGSMPTSYYLLSMIAGFGLGLGINISEVSAAFSSDFNLLVTNTSAQPGYHLARLGMSFAYLNLFILICKLQWWKKVRMYLASAGRMALSNYLMQSLIALFIFTGAGLGLVGKLERWQLYLIVLAIWIIQLIYSSWWLKKFNIGPVEWLWRYLTGSKQHFLKEELKSS